MWAERRTDVVAGADGADGGEPDVEAVSLWVHLEPSTGVRRR